MSSLNNITLESDDSRLALIALGANLASAIGTPKQTLSAAIEILSESCNGKLAASSFYQTEAVDCAPGTSDFINAVVAAPVSKSVTAIEFLKQLQALERRFGRIDDGENNSPRPLDLDILFFGEQVHSEPELEIPHPRVYQRRFVLEPLAELAPNLVLPGQSVSVQELLSALPSSPEVVRLL